MIRGLLNAVGEGPGAAGGGAVMKFVELKPFSPIPEPNPLRGSRKRTYTSVGINAARKTGLAYLSPCPPHAG